MTHTQQAKEEWLRQFDSRFILLPEFRSLRDFFSYFATSIEEATRRDVVEEVGKRIIEEQKYIPKVQNEEMKQYVCGKRDSLAQLLDFLSPSIKEF